jgi:hypothetical protein
MSGMSSAFHGMKSLLNASRVDYADIYITYIQLRLYWAPLHINLSLVSSL